MKNNIIITFVVVICLALAVPVFAETPLNGPLPGGGAAVTTTIGGAIFQPSTNVFFSIVSTDSTGTPPNAYCAASQNASVAGNAAGRQFGATNTSAIMYGTATATSTPSACTTAGTVPATITTNL